MKNSLFLLNALLIGSLLNAAKGPSDDFLAEDKAAIKVERSNAELGAESKQPSGRLLPRSWRPSSKWTSHSPYSMMYPYSTSSQPSEFQRLEAQRQRIIQTGGTPELKANESGGHYYHRAEPKPQPRSAADIFDGKSEEKILKEVQHSKKFLDRLEYWLDFYSKHPTPGLSASDAAAMHAALDYESYTHFDQRERDEQREKDEERAERNAENQRMRNEHRAIEQARRAQRNMERQQQRVVQRPVLEAQATMSENQRRSDLMTKLVDPFNEHTF